ncbi:MAG: hypothetical protein O2780_05155 [Proteobacteria bacterium]|jgi:hypothetical protein|nr:hypothetical protein [Pseudomonadota bacterium]MDA1301567.1 hypothetical protein [Pseudomonadota bacterium]
MKIKAIGLFTLTMLVTSVVSGAEEASFSAKCEAAFQQPDRAETMCGCIKGGLEQQGNGDEILAVLARPRGERRQAMQAMSDASRRVVMSCMRGLIGDRPAPGS